MQFIADKLREFDAAGPKLRALMHRAALGVVAARQANKPDAVAEFTRRREAIASLFKLHGVTSDKLASVRAWLREQGFGAIVVPVLVAGAAVAAAASITYVLRETGLEAKRLELLEKGVLTPEQLTQLNRESKPSLVNVDLKGVAPWLIGGALLWWWVRSRARGGVRDW